ncbi:MAG: hypothetical protein MJ245_01020 [Clostridia bacterium]|nr:hypothetical protein [Clostridia bacterium]
MQKDRASYIPDVKYKSTIAWPVMTLVSFLIILVLIVLLVFSHLDTINNIVNIAQIENKIKELNEEYNKAVVDTEDVTNKLLQLKSDLVALDETEGTKLNFYNHMNTLSTIKTSFPNSLYQSFNTKNILKDNSDRIFIGSNGNVVILNDYLFNDNSNTFTKNSDDFIKVLAKRLYDTLSDATYGRFIESINIDMYLDSDYSENDAKLSYDRGNKLREELLNKNSELKNNFDKKIAVRIFNDSNKIFTKDESNKNNRIEVTLTISNDSILGGIKNFIEVKPKENDLNSTK